MALDVPVGWNTCALTTPGARCPVEEATWSESTENTTHCACWHESDYGDEPCCWCGAAGRFEAVAKCPCLDCDAPIMSGQGDAKVPLCPSCQETAAQAQRDHQVREAAHDLLAALESIENDDGRIPPAIWRMRCDAIAKARGKEE